VIFKFFLKKIFNYQTGLIPLRLDF